MIQAQQLLELNVNNEQVLAKQLQATNDRFRVGEITRTDVAQAEAALEGARRRVRPRRAHLQTARGTFQQIIGVFPPADLVQPQPLNLPVRSETEAAAGFARSNNPNVISRTVQRRGGEGRGRRGVRRSCCRSSACRARPSSRTTPARAVPQTNGYQVDRAAFACRSTKVARNIPRCARRARREQQTQRLIDDAKRTAVQNAVQAWDTLVAAQGRPPTAPGRRSAPTRSRWKARSARPSSAAAPRWTC